MACKVGSARSSYGNTAAGDQNGGKEVSTQDWYLHSLGWVALVPISDAVANDIADCMQWACDNNNIGYDQNTRNMLYNAAKVYNFDVSKVTKKVNTDCSALTRVCCNYAGIPVGDFTTGNLVDTLMKTGKFVKYTCDKYCKTGDYLPRGTILCTKSKGHVVIVVKPGDKAAKPIYDKTYITITGDSVNVRKAAGTTYGIIRTVRKGMILSYTDTKTVNGTKWYHIADGWVSGKYAKEG